MRKWNKLRCFSVKNTDIAGDDTAEEEIDNGSLFMPWWEIEADGYIHDNVCRILYHAKHDEELLWLLSRPQWIISRLQNDGIYAVENDLEIGKTVAREAIHFDHGLVKHLEVVRKAARLACTYVNNNKREAWFQLYGRLLWYATHCNRTRQFVREIEYHAPRPWARASLGFLQQAGGAAVDVLPSPGSLLSIVQDQEKVSLFWRDSDQGMGVTRYNVGNGVVETYELGINGKVEVDLRHSGCAALSHEMKVLSIGFWDGLMVICRLETGQIIRCSQKHDDRVTCMTFTDDGSRVVSGSADTTVRVWDVESGEPMGNSLCGHTDRVWCVSISRDGTRVVSGSRDMAVRVWDVTRGEAVGQPLLGHTGWVLCVAMSQCGTRVVSGAGDATVRMWEIESGKPLGQPLVGHSDPVTCVAISPDGTRVVSGSMDNTVRVWEVGSAEPVGKPLLGHTGWVECVTISQDGRRVVSGSTDKTVRIWEVASEEPVGPPPFSARRPLVLCVAISRDENRVVSGSHDGTIQVWELRNGKPVGQSLVGHKRAVVCATFSWDGSRVVSGSADETVRVWDVESGKQVAQPFVGHTDTVRCVSTSPDGTRVVSGSDDQTVRVWERASGEMVGQPLIGHTGWVKCVAALNRNGSRVVSGSYDESVRVWDVCSGKEITSPFVHSSYVIGVSVSEDGSQVVSSETGGIRRLWSVEDRRCVMTSNDATWQTTIDALGLSLERNWDLTLSSNEMTYEQPDGRRIVLGTGEGRVSRVGDSWFWEDSCRHCKVVL